MKTYEKPLLHFIELADALCDSPLIHQSNYEPDESIGSKGRRGVWGDLWFDEDSNE